MRAFRQVSGLQARFLGGCRSCMKRKHAWYDLRAGKQDSGFGPSLFVDSARARGVSDTAAPTIFECNIRTFAQ